MHQNTFEYLKPTDLQLADMADLRQAFATFASFVEMHVPPGLDRDHVMRHLRTAAMWANVAITRLDDGTPRV